MADVPSISAVVDASPELLAAAVFARAARAASVGPSREPGKSVSRAMLAACRATFDLEFGLGFSVSNPAWTLVAPVVRALERRGEALSNEQLAQEFAQASIRLGGRLPS